jgi:hypothetical protein
MLWFGYKSSLFNAPQQRVSLLMCADSEAGEHLSFEEHASCAGMRPKLAVHLTSQAASASLRFASITSVVQCLPLKRLSVFALCPHAAVALAKEEHNGRRAAVLGRLMTFPSTRFQRCFVGFWVSDFSDMKSASRMIWPQL